MTIAVKRIYTMRVKRSTMSISSECMKVCKYVYVPNYLSVIVFISDSFIAVSSILCRILYLRHFLSTAIQLIVQCRKNMNEMRVYKVEVCPLCSFSFTLLNVLRVTPPVQLHQDISVTQLTVMNLCSVFVPSQQSGTSGSNITFCFGLLHYSYITRLGNY